jgi:hypothetical protein
LIFVGADKKVFKVQKELLTLHSGYFRNRIDSKKADNKLSLPDVKPSGFAEFVSWLYAGEALLFRDYLYDDIELGYLWALGELLEVPAFQNWCMNTFLEDCKNPNSQWPALEVVKVIYETSPKGSKLRKFAAHSMACDSPFEKHWEGDKMYEGWNTLLEDILELGPDIARVAGKQWNGTYPWDGEHRQAYLKVEVAPDQLWEEQILAARSIEEIKTAAKGNCLRSMIELAHIERKKGNN